MKRSKIRTAAVGLILSLIFSLAIAPGYAEEDPIVRINEVGWAGTNASEYDEWIELKNNTDEQIELTGWKLSWRQNTENPVVVEFSGSDEEGLVIPANGFCLLERSNDNTVKNIKADFIYSGGLSNGGEMLVLKSSDGEVIDQVDADPDGWPAGAASDGSPPYASMERTDSSDSKGGKNWRTSNGQSGTGKDAEGDSINGTPKEKNSVNGSS